MLFFGNFEPYAY